MGVSNIPKIIKRKWKNQYNELSATLDVFVDLVSTQRGIHMSRNIEAINEVTSELIDKVITDTEELCAQIAEKVLKVQN
ncbi:MAG: GTP cyclohydrolase, FolE2/MptA family, partial [Candidatus Heimdallarchaeaceae archaeon]